MDKFQGRLTIAMPGWYCPKCGEGLYTHADMKVSDRALNAMKARCEGLLDGPQVKRIRKKLGLTQAATGDLIGGGPKAFTKYEKGDALTSRAVTNLLKVLDALPDALTSPLEVSTLAKCSHCSTSLLEQVEQNWSKKSRWREMEGLGGTEKS